MSNWRRWIPDVAVSIASIGWIVLTWMAWQAYAQAFQTPSSPVSASLSVGQALNVSSTIIDEIRVDGKVVWRKPAPVIPWKCESDKGCTLSTEDSAVFEDIGYDVRSLIGHQPVDLLVCWKDLAGKSFHCIDSTGKEYPAKFLEKEKVK